uniref:GNAT family N-acetyltransferase n=1 Tax=uncultured Rhizobium sp. TaxID=155567 RepID=UPI00260AFEA7|nr:GNAT family N-acetyltransferase [uncultured Rhizobium sp.]
MTHTIRDANPADEAQWRRLWAGYLTFYKVELEPAVTDSTWKRIIDPASPVSMRVVEQGGTLAGFAIHLLHPSTWVMNNDCYLEDLYLDPAFRGQGLGRALLDDLVDMAKTNGWSRLYWHTDEGNATARKLYDSYVKTDGHVRYRMRIS